MDADDIPDKDFLANVFACSMDEKVGIIVGNYELYNTSTKQILAKSNNPLDFDKHIDKIFGKEAARRVRDFQAEQEEERA